MRSGKAGILSRYLMILPALSIFLGFYFLPFLSGLFLGFTAWDGFGAIKFVGLRNYIALFKSLNGVPAVFRTVELAFLIAVLQNLFALVLAFVLDQRLPGRNLFRSLFFLPAIISPIVIGYLWAFLLSPSSGVFRHVSDLLNLSGAPRVNLLGDPHTALLVIGMTVVWQYTGFTMVIYLAGMSSIPPELIESSVLDGANAVQRLLKITLPMIAHSITINFVLTVPGALVIFDQIYISTNGGPGRATETLTVMIFKEGFGAMRIGYGTAAATVLFVFILVLVVVMAPYLRKREIEL